MSRASASDASAEGATFDHLGDLPQPGITLLQASAGTGKTYTIAGLVVRYLAAGVSVEDLLVVTFTKAATGELRTRVRRRLIEADAGLRAWRTGRSVKEDDQALVGVLAAGTPADVALVQERLGHAIANFDAATITTTHGFCEAALAELGLAGDSELRPEFVPDLRELTRQTASDVFVNRYANASETPIASDKAQKLVEAALQAWDAVIEPTQTDDATTLARVQFVKDVKVEIDRRKRIAGLMTFDDQVGRLKKAVTDPDRGAHAAAALQRRYKVVLVDEFQDTDTSQWVALRTAFGTGTSTLILIGDPKQAIYSFRGADVFAYLDARNSADSTATLGTNFRSSAGVLSSLDALFGSLELGDPKIRYASSRAAGLERNSELPSLRFREIVKETAVARTKSRKNVAKGPGIALIAADVAADIVKRLARGGDESVKPGDIAVLTNRHLEAEQVADALRVRGVPAVIRGSKSVLATDAGLAVRRLLEALEQPSSQWAVRRLAATSLIGFSVDEFASDDAADAPLNRLQRDVQDWAEILVEAGLEAAYGGLKRKYNLVDRLLGEVGGERVLTDLDQVVELVGSYAVTEGVRSTGLLPWLKQRMTESGTSEVDERTRRLDTDAAAVQVITVHAAKGLEYDIVYCPFLWTPYQKAQVGDPMLYHAEGLRRLYVGTDTSAAQRNAAAEHDREAAGESLRKTYVAMTRAKRELVVHWADGSDWHRSPLGVILAQHDQSPSAALIKLSTGCNDIAVEPILRLPSPDSWRPAESAHPVELELSTFDRSVDSVWRRTSFSAMTAGAHERALLPGSEPPTGRIKSDELDVEVDFGGASGPAMDSLPDIASALSDLRGGASIGSFVHLVFEGMDFAATDLATEIKSRIDLHTHEVRLTDDEKVLLSAGLVAAVETPLGRDVADIRLRDIDRADRIDEMGFEFAIAGGQKPIGDISTQAIADVLDQHLEPGDLLRGYLPHLRDPMLDNAAHGYLSGSIDLVMRTLDGDVSRFSVVDYKTNRLGAGRLTPWDYRPAAVRDAVFESHYPLQFLLYAVALHRYLRARFPGYSPDRNLGPVKYLFVRGMFGAENPELDGAPCGIFSWQPPGVVVETLSDLMATGVTSEID